MSSKAERARAMAAENRRLRSAIGAIHDLLHHGQFDAAHEACECAMSGEVVSQPSLGTGDTVRVNSFVGDFNTLARRYKLQACTIVAVPIQGKREFSLQIGGEVEICKVVEAKMAGTPSLYRGDVAGAADGG